MGSGLVFDIKEMTVHDGPGVRVTVFLKGCPLRCTWCHNPEGLSPKPELFRIETGCTNCGRCRCGCDHPECQPFGTCVHICPQNLLKVSGEVLDSSALARRLKKYEDPLSQLGGGITVSGGEPLMQADFLLELLEKLKPMHTAVQTSGHGDSKKFIEVIHAASLILFDLKIMDPILHRKFTGVDNGLILRNLEALIASDKDFIARVPLIPGVNDTEANFTDLAKALEDARSRVRVEVMPYNRLAGAKYRSVGLVYSPEFDELGKLYYPVNVLENFDIPYLIL